MPPTVILFSLALSAASLRVQQRGADVKISRNSTLELKEKTQLGAVIGAEAQAWAKGTGPLYSASVKDLLRIAHWQMMHPIRCFRGWDPTDTTATGVWPAWDPPLTAYASYTAAGTSISTWSFTTRMNCLINNPIKWKAIVDPFDFHSYGTAASNEWAKLLSRWRWADPWHLIQNNFADSMWIPGSPAMIKKWDWNGQLPEVDCTGNVDKAIMYYVAREDDNGNVVNGDVLELFSGGSMMLSTANNAVFTPNAQGTGTGSLCYVRLHYSNPASTIPDLHYKFVKCACALGAGAGGSAFNSGNGYCKKYADYATCMANGASENNPGSDFEKAMGETRNCEGTATHGKVKKNFVSWSGCR